MAKITYSDKANLNSLPTVNAENKVSDTDMNEVKTVVNDIDTQLSTYFSLRYKELWTGTWNGGNISVTDVSKYNSIIVFVDTNDCIVCHRNGDGTKFQGAAILGSSSNYNQYSKLFICSVNGDTLTWSVARELGHNASGNHNSGSAKTVSKIIGLDPIITWT